MLSWPNWRASEWVGFRPTYGQIGKHSSKQLVNKNFALINMLHLAYCSRRPERKMSGRIMFVLWSHKSDRAEWFRTKHRVGSAPVWSAQLSDVTSSKVLWPHDADHWPWPITAPTPTFSSFYGNSGLLRPRVWPGFLRGKYQPKWKSVWKLRHFYQLRGRDEFYLSNF